MDPLEKKRLANERRLKAIQDQKMRNQQNRTGKVFKIDKNIPTKTVQKNQIKLFDSDGEEENCEDMFKIRPQFEGRNGLQLLEMSSKFSSRFKLDERFKDEEDVVKPTTNTETEEEMDKNFKILESILGYEVSKKLPEKQNINKKRFIERFDPEDEETSKYVKQNVSSNESKKKPPKKKKKVEVEEKEAEPIPISNERYIEVSSNLKDLFQSSSTFSFSSKFSSNDDPEGNKIFDDLNNPFTNTGSKKADGNLSSDVGPKKTNSGPPKKDIFESKNIFTFFIQEDDTIIKEGLGYVRTKPLEEIRESWTKKKNNLMELYRMKKKSFSRKLVNKKPTTQGKRTFIKK